MAEHTLDCLGEICPVPLLKTQKAAAKLVEGDVLIVETDHSCAIKNIPEWLGKAGFDYEVEEVASGQWDIIIAK